VRRDRRAHMPPALVLRLQPAGRVRLVPQQVAVHLVAVPRRHRPRELAELDRRRLPARVAAPRRAARPRRPGAGHAQHHPQPCRADGGDGEIERGPVVVGVGRVARAEPGRLALGRDVPPLRVDAHDVDAERLPLGDRRGGGFRLAEQQALVLHSDLQPGCRQGIPRGGAGPRAGASGSCAPQQRDQEDERQPQLSRRPPPGATSGCSSEGARRRRPGRADRP
jgi:hypothetical protein